MNHNGSLYLLFYKRDGNYCFYRKIVLLMYMYSYVIIGDVIHFFVINAI